jgi:hypothetical protein
MSFVAMKAPFEDSQGKPPVGPDMEIAGVARHGRDRKVRNGAIRNFLNEVEFPDEGIQTGAENQGRPDRTFHLPSQELFGLTPEKAHPAALP